MTELDHAPVGKLGADLVPRGVTHRTVSPHVIVLFGATGDLARRKLVPGLFHLFRAGLLSDCRIVATSMDELDDAGYLSVARRACDEFARGGVHDDHWSRFRDHIRYEGYRWTEGVAPDSETETFIALRCEIDNWRWAGVPFYLRTGKQMAESARIVSIAFWEPPKSMFPPDSGAGSHGPDHLTFDLADASKLSLSFYGKRPGPGMKLDKLSLQFAIHETDQADNVLEAYERLLHDAMHGDQTLFTNADGIERLWEVSHPLLDDPPDVQLYRVGSWGPDGIRNLIAPGTWRLPFERAWRQPA